MKEAIKNELLDAFNRGLIYHPLIQRLTGLSKELQVVIDDAAALMCEEQRTSAKDINEAKETIKLLRMSLNTTFDPERHTTVEDIEADEALREALHTICPRWPFFI